MSDNGVEMTPNIGITYIAIRPITMRVDINAVQYNVEYEMLKCSGRREADAK